MQPSMYAVTLPHVDQGLFTVELPQSYDQRLQTVAHSLSIAIGTAVTAQTIIEMVMCKQKIRPHQVRERLIPKLHSRDASLELVVACWPEALEIVRVPGTKGKRALARKRQDMETA